MTTAMTSAPASTTIHSIVLRRRCARRRAARVPAAAASRHRRHPSSIVQPDGRGRRVVSASDAVTGDSSRVGSSSDTASPRVADDLRIPEAPSGPLVARQHATRRVGPASSQVGIASHLDDAARAVRVAAAVARATNGRTPAASRAAGRRSVVVDVVHGVRLDHPAGFRCEIEHDPRVVGAGLEQLRLGQGLGRLERFVQHRLPRGCGRPGTGAPRAEGDRTRPGTSGPVRRGLGTGRRRARCAGRESACSS